MASPFERKKEKKNNERVKNSPFVSFPQYKPIYSCGWTCAMVAEQSNDYNNYSHHLSQWALVLFLLVKRKKNGSMSPNFSFCIYLTSAYWKCAQCPARGVGPRTEHSGLGSCPLEGTAGSRAAATPRSEGGGESRTPWKYSGIGGLTHIGGHWWGRGLPRGTGLQCETFEMSGKEGICRKECSRQK